MNTKTPSIGVSGASGNLGSATLRELRARANGERLIGISRTPEKIVGADETRFGDYDKPESLAAAYAGLDRLLVVLSAELRPGKRGEQNVAAIDAAGAAGVGHVVFLSSAGAYDVPEPDILASYFRAEHRLVKTAPSWSVLRMNYYAEAVALEAQMSLAGGSIFGLAESRAGYVSRDPELCPRSFATPLVDLNDAREDCQRKEFVFVGGSARIGRAGARMTYETNKHDVPGASGFNERRANHE
jgi:uncharacterized protein YbjT (DUF2867 family)